jgi:hypothetical protein
MDVRGPFLRELRGDVLAPGPSGESKLRSFRESESKSVSERCGGEAWRQAHPARARRQSEVHSGRFRACPVPPPMISLHLSSRERQPPVSLVI